MRYYKMAIRNIIDKIIPAAEKAFINDKGDDEMCKATGREGLINGFWWPEYVDSLGGLHYGR